MGMIPEINAWASAWADIAGWAVVQNTVFLAAVLLLLHVLRNAPARIRCWIGMAGLVKLVIPPFIPISVSRPVPVLFPSKGQTGVPMTLDASAIPLSAPRLSAAAILFMVWLAFLLLFLLWPVVSSWLLRRRLSGAVPVEPSPTDGFRILKTDKIRVPLTFGFLQESVYVPALWEDWTEDMRRMILAHEFAHIRRKDRLGRILQILVQAVWFFHPMVWLVSRKVDESREMACDDMTTGKTKERSIEYSKALVHIAERLVRVPSDRVPASALIRQKNELLNRVRYQLEDVVKPPSKKRIALALAGLAFLTLSLSWTKTSTAPPDEPVPAAPAVGQDSSKTDWMQRFMSLPEGGTEAIQKNLVYPEAARKAGLEGMVVVRVLYTQDGFRNASIKESSFEPGKDMGCLQAALDAVRSVPWSRMKNAEAGGYFDMPLAFSLDPQPGTEEIRKKVEQDILKHLKEEKPGDLPSIVGGVGELLKVMPYPEEARKAGIEDTVLVRAHIDSTGRVAETKILRSSRPGYGFEKVAENAIRSVQWKPAFKNGRPVDAWVAVPFRFNLPSAEAGSAEPETLDDKSGLKDHILWLIGEINAQYVKPSPEFKGNRKATALRIMLNTKGQICSLGLHSSCGDSVYDWAAENAVMKMTTQRTLRKKLKEYEEFIMLVDLGVGGDPEMARKWYAWPYKK
jgi:TonB family protein